MTLGLNQLFTMMNSAIYSLKNMTGVSRKTNKGLVTSVET